MQDNGLAEYSKRSFISLFNQAKTLPFLVSKLTNYLLQYLKSVFSH